MHTVIILPPSLQKQCQVAVLPLGTGKFNISTCVCVYVCISFNLQCLGNDLARVLGWGSSCDDETNLAQMLERYERASMKFLDRWSLMAYERTTGLRTPKMSISQPGPDCLLLQFQNTAMCQLQVNINWLARHGMAVHACNFN